MTLERLRVASPLLSELSAENLWFMETLATELGFAAGEVVFDMDEPADVFYLIAEGRVALEVDVTARGTSVVETLGPGELLGVSWIFPSARWNWRARAVEPTTAVGFDAAAVRSRCGEDRDLAVHVYGTVAAEAVRRLHATRVRLLDPYVEGSA